MIPLKAIHSTSDLDSFKSSKTYQEIFGFVKLCGDSVVGKSCNSINSTTIIETIIMMRSFLNQLYDLVDEIPPIQQPMRFGNKAFRHWHARMKEEIPIFMAQFLQDDKQQYSIELAEYLLNAFGNETRLDFGTGHELNFVLLCLGCFKLGLWEGKDLASLILIVYQAYLRTVKKILETYILEPAGSHGVWGLDDYYCLQFVFGAAQLCGHSTITPLAIRSDHIYNDDTLCQQYIYISGIRFIRTLKFAVSFSESSPMLYDISGLSDWPTVYKGLLKLFQGEVLQKFPVAQHILFGTLIPCTWHTTTIPVEPPIPMHNTLPASTAAAAAGIRSIGPPTIPLTGEFTVATPAPWAHTGNAVSNNHRPNISLSQQSIITPTSNATTTTTTTISPSASVGTATSSNKDHSASSTS